MLEVSIKKDLGQFVLDVDFTVKSADVMGLLGASGSGKSMTLKCIAGIETPDEGRIVLNGRVLFDSTEKINVPTNKRKVGYLFQNYALFPTMTVEQNILCGLHAEKDNAKRKEICAKMIEKMSLTGFEKRKPAKLSGGQQQRVALARILVTESEILLLDEPFSALDSHLKLQVENEMKKTITEYGKDVIFVSHDKDEISRLCTGSTTIENGRLKK